MKKRLIIFMGIATFIIFGFGLTYSMFISDGNLVSNTELATFIFEAKKTDEIELPLLDINPGDNKEYLFSVTNTDTVDTSDVLIEYKIKLKTYHFIPLKLELFSDKEGVETLIFNCTEDMGRNSEGELECVSDVLTLDFKTQEVDDYKLKVSFEEAYNDWQYADLVDYVNLEIEAEQKISE